jgi:aliphatic sulfonates family ABC transporter substrate-binding protein
MATPAGAWTRRGAALALAAALAGCSGPGAAPGARGLGRPLRIGFQRSGVVLLAKARGVLSGALRGQADGVQWVEFPAGPPLMEALGAGAIDLGAVGETPPIFAQAAGAPIVYAAAQPVSGASEAILVPPRSHARTLADLRGRAVAFTKASSAHLFVVQALRRAGMSLKDIQPVYLSPGDAAGAFSSGAVDAWCVWDPYYALAQRNRAARVLMTGDGLPSTSGFLMATRDLARAHPAVLAAALDALKAEAAWSVAHGGEVAGFLASGAGLPLDVAAASLRRGPFRVRPMDENIIAAQQRAADVFLDIGAIPTRIDVAADAWRGWVG